MNYIVYVLRSVLFEKSYVGYTNDLERRVKEHNSGKNYYTRRFKPWKVIYTEEYKNVDEARRREKYFKSHSGRERVMRKLFKNL